MVRTGLKFETRPIDKGIAVAIIAEATPRAVRSGPHDCLIWPDRIDQAGYGSTGWAGLRAHRVAWTAAHEDPGPLLVRHVVCGNRACFDHEHLALGTDADNAADTSRMGRHNPRRVMTDEVAQEAAARVNAGETINDVAASLNVGHATLARYVKPYLDPSVTTSRHARKVTDEDVLAARLDYTHGRATMQQIKDRLGISWPAAQKMVQGRTYRHVGFAHVGDAVVVPRSERTCAVEGCDRPVLAKGWCTAHYNRVQTHGDPQAHTPIGERPVHEPAECSVPGCTHPVKTRGWCNGHYNRWRKHGDVQADIPLRPWTANGDTCTVDGCGRPARTKGLCGTHYARVLAHGDPQADVPIRGSHVQ